MSRPIFICVEIVMRNRYEISTVLTLLVLLITLFTARVPQLVYAQPSDERSPVHKHEMYTNGTWYEGDNTTVGAEYRDWHGLQWWFKEFGLRNWSENKTDTPSHALDWGTFIDTPLKDGADVTLPVAANLTYRNGTVVSLPAGSLLELPPGSAIQSFYTLGNLGGGVCVVYPDPANLTYSSTDTGVWNETQLEHFVVEGYLTGNFYRSNVTYLDTSEGRTINWYIGYTGCSNITETIGRTGGGDEYNPNPYNITFEFDIRFDMHILHTINFTRIKSDVNLTITQLALPESPSNATFGVALRFSHFVKPVFPGGDPEIRVNGRDFVFSAKTYRNETGTYEVNGFKILDFELPKDFALYTSDGSNKTLDAKRSMFLDIKAVHPSWNNYTASDVGFFGLPYGTVNTTRIVYDPVITVYHPTTTAPPVWYEVMWPFLVATGVAVAVAVVYVINTRRKLPIPESV